MFIYTIRAATVKFFGIISVSLVLLIALIAFVPAYATGHTANDPTAAAQIDLGSKSYRYDKIKTEADAAAFLRQFGWEVDDTPREVCRVKVPGEFDQVFTTYNELQKTQGLDLSRYKKKTLTRYTFSVKNYPADPADAMIPVYANVLVWKNRVVGGDICSADVNGFVAGFDLEK